MIRIRTIIFLTEYLISKKKGLHPGDLFVCYRFVSNNALLADLLLKFGIIKPKISGTVGNHLHYLIF